ncbi:DUF4440 domain-containing protein [Serratia quinivorans]|uniref:nuclear transport factor 2 family protein n=1 Tax=Serratia quinivorans TaxID=137545 RepID=UPI003F5EDF72
MTDSTRLLVLIQSLEVKLHQPVTRNNVAVVSELLHDDFEEIGRSGHNYDKQQTLAALQIESGQTPIFSEGFKLAIITEGTVLLTYLVFNRVTMVTLLDVHCDRRSGCCLQMIMVVNGRCVFIRARRPIVDTGDVEPQTNNHQ